MLYYKNQMFTNSTRERVCSVINCKMPFFSTNKAMRNKNIVLVFLYALAHIWLLRIL